MALQLYTNALCYVNGTLLAEESSVKIDRATNAQQVLTTAKGFAGMSPGAMMTSVSVSNGVPAADFELNPGPFMKSLQVVELTIFAAGRTMTFKGFFTDDSFQHAVNTDAKLDFTFVGEPADWQ